MKLDSGFFGSLMESARYSSAKKAEILGRLGRGAVVEKPLGYLDAFRCGCARARLLGAKLAMHVEGMPMGSLLVYDEGSMPDWKYGFVLPSVVHDVSEDGECTFSCFTKLGYYEPDAHHTRVDAFGVALRSSLSCATYLMDDGYMYAGEAHGLDVLYDCIRNTIACFRGNTIELMVHSSLDRKYSSFFEVSVLEGDGAVVLEINKAKSSCGAVHYTLSFDKDTLVPDGGVTVHPWRKYSGFDGWDGHQTVVGFAQK